MLQKILSTIIILIIASSLSTTYAGSIGVSMKERKRVEDLMQGINQESIRDALKYDIKPESGTGTGEINSFSINLPGTEGVHTHFDLYNTSYEFKYDASSWNGHISLKWEARVGLRIKEANTNTEKSTGATFDFDLDIFLTREDIRIRLNAFDFKRGILWENPSLGKSIEDDASEVLGTTYKISPNYLTNYLESIEHNKKVFSTKGYKVTKRIGDGIYQIRPTQAIIKLAQDAMLENKFWEPVDPQKGYIFQWKFIENKTGTNRLEYDFIRSKKSFMRGFYETTPTVSRSEAQVRVSGNTLSTKSTKENNIFTLSQISTTSSYVTETQVTNTPEALSMSSARKLKSKRINPEFQISDSFMMNHHIKTNRFSLEISEGLQKNLIKVSHAPRGDSLFETNLSMVVHPPGKPDITTEAKIAHYPFQKEKVEIDVPPIDISINIIPGASK